MERARPARPRTARFGDDFALDLEAHRLTRGGRLVRLERIPRELLRLLIDRHAEVVTREEIVARIWGPDVFLDTNNAINGAVRKIRLALRDDAELPRFVETVTGRGYRFLAPISFDQDPVASSGEEVPRPVPIAGASSRSPLRRIRPTFAIAGVVILLLIGGPVAYDYAAAGPTTPVARFVQPSITDRAEPWHDIVTDGSRVYFLERAGGGWNVAHAPRAGGAVNILPVPLKNTRLLGVSPDGSEFLIASFTAPGSRLPLWIWPVKGGEPARVGDVVATDANWTPDGSIIYSRGSDIRLVSREGRGDRLLLQVDGEAYKFRWAPDGRRLSFTVGNPRTSGHTLWEANPDGTHARMRVTPMARGERVCCGQWTPDGAYFLYAASSEGLWNLWAIKESRWFGWGRPQPVQLTNAESSIYDAVPVGHRRILTFVDGARFDHVRYSPASGQFSPLLGDVQALGLRFSPDFRSAVFQRRSDGSLWRSDIDGAGGLQLLGTRVRAAQPRWSPDGRSIAFESRISGEVRAYVMSATGGAPDALLPDYPGTQSLPDWAPDGRSLVVALNYQRPRHAFPQGIHIVDRDTRQATKLAGSEGLTAPFWSPDGRYLLALGWAEQSMVRFDHKAQEWIEIATGGRLSGFSWSKDSRYLYVQDVLAAGMPVYRLRAPAFERDATFTLDSLLTRGIQRAVFLGLTLDGDLIIKLTRAGTLIYALDLDLP
jgi:Tol biopolymer transport system component/DNA-binding winged helix-turn-helix (wHTH) protein